MSHHPRVFSAASVLLLLASAPNLAAPAPPSALPSFEPLWKPPIAARIPAHVRGARVAAETSSPWDVYWTNQFGLPVVSGSILSLAYFGGQIVAGGGFDQCGTTHARFIAAWDGSAWHELGNSITHSVWALQPYAGGLVAAGGAGAGQPTIQLWNGSSWADLGATNGTVYALAVYNGDLVAGGSFSSVNGVAAANVARWDGSTWHAMAGGLPTVNAYGVRALTLHGAQLIAAGYFAPDSSHIAAWDGSSWSTLSVGGDRSATVKGMVSDGAYLYTVGSIRSEPEVAKWDGSSWTLLPGSNGTGAYAIGLWQGQPVVIQGQPQRWDGTVWQSLGDSLRCTTYAFLNAGGRLYVGGYKATIGQNMDRLVSFDGTTWRIEQAPWSPGSMAGVGGVIYDARACNGQLYVAGDFRSVGAQDHFDPAPLFAGWNGTAWSSLSGSGGSLFEGFALDTLGTDLVLGGWFSHLGGLTGLNGIARWNGSALSPMGSGLLPWVYTLAHWNGQLIAGGLFYNVSGQSGVARWDGSTWQPLLATAFVDDYPNTMAQWGVDLYLGGAFTDAGGTAVSGLARWNGTAFTDVGGGVSGSPQGGGVYALAAYGGGLVVGGDFTHAGGVPASGCALWDGSAWTPMDANAEDIYKFLVTGGRLFAVGDFIAPDLSVRGGLAWWDGASWDLLGSGLDPGGATGLAEYGGDLYMVGGFGFANGVPSYSVARFEGVANILDTPTEPTGELVLASPWPNPSRSSASLAFTVPMTGRARLAIYDASGRRIATLLDGPISAGRHAAEWDGRGASGRTTAPGLYFARLETARGVRLAKVVRIE